MHWRLCSVVNLYNHYSQTDISCISQYKIYKSTFFTEHVSEAVAQRCSVKKMFLKISNNSQENTCARVSFITKLHRYATLLKKRL